MRVDMVPGQSYDLVSNQEMQAHIASIQAQMSRFVRAEIEGIRPLRLQPLYLNVSGGLFSGIIPGPELGYSWLVRRISTFGFTAGDVNSAIINLFHGDSAQPVNFVDQLIANSAWKASADCLVCHGGENMFVTGSGVTSTTAIAVSGSVVQVPAEMIGKLL